MAYPVTAALFDNFGNQRRAYGEDGKINRRADTFDCFVASKAENCCMSRIDRKDGAAEAGADKISKNAIAVAASTF